MSNVNDPMVYMLKREKKIYLVTWAKERKLDPSGTKLDLALRLAEHEYQRFSKDWETISNA